MIFKTTLAYFLRRYHLYKRGDHPKFSTPLPLNIKETLEVFFFFGGWGGVGGGFVTQQFIRSQRDSLSLISKAIPFCNINSCMYCLKFCIPCVSLCHSLRNHVYGLFIACFLFQILVHIIGLEFCLLLIHMYRSKVISLFEIVDLQEISSIKTSFHISTKIDLKLFCINISLIFISTKIDLKFFCIKTSLIFYLKTNLKFFA